MPPKELSNRVVRGIAVRAGVRDCVIYERKGRDVLVAALVCALPVLCGFALEGLVAPPVRIVFTILAAALAVFVVLAYLPRGVRIRVDFDAGTGQLAWRYLWIPLRRVPFELDGRVFALGDGELRTTRTVRKDSSALWGCILGAIFGPLAALFAPSAKTEEVYEAARGLVLRERGAGRSEFLLAVRNEESVEDVLLVLAQLYDAA